MTMNQTALDIVSFGVAGAFVLLAAAIIFVLFKYNAKFCDMLLEADGSKASVSRFQLVFFTVIIGGAYLEKFLETGTFKLDETALALLGISSGSFLVSKGISASSTAQQAQTAQQGQAAQQAQAAQLALAAQQAAPAAPPPTIILRTQGAAS